MDSREAGIKENMYTSDQIAWHISDLMRRYRKIWSVIEEDVNTRLHRLEQKKSETEFRLIAACVNEGLEEIKAAEAIAEKSAADLCNNMTHATGICSNIITDLEHAEMTALISDRFAKL